MLTIVSRDAYMGDNATFKMQGVHYYKSQTSYLWEEAEVVIGTQHTEDTSQWSAKVYFLTYVVLSS